MAAEQESMVNEKIVIIEATVPTGFEEVARDEAVEKFGLDCRSARGKITFRVPFDRVKQVLQLGGIDNCRVQMLHIPSFDFTKDTHDCLSRLQLMVKNVDWAEGLTVWKEFFSFEHPIPPCPEKVPTDEELIDVCIMTRKPQSSSGGKKKKKKYKRKDGREKRGRAGGHELQSTEESNDRVSLTQQQHDEPSEDVLENDIQAASEKEIGEDGSVSAKAELKRNHDQAPAPSGDEGDISPEKKSPEKTVVEKLSTCGDAAESKMLVDSKSTADVDGGLEGDVKNADEISASPAKAEPYSAPTDSNEDIVNKSTKSSQLPKPEGKDHTDNDTVDDSVTPDGTQSAELEDLQQAQGGSNTSGETQTEEDLTPPKPQRDPTKPAFRVTCNRSGEHHSFDSMSAAASFGSAVQTYFGWNVDMKNFNIEVILNVDNEEVSVGIGLTQASLHYRNLVAFGVTTLRPTICYNMLRMCKIRDGHVVCDPMCGTGSISIQGALGWPKTLQLCGENFPKALEKTSKNKEAIDADRQKNNSGKLKMDIVRWDACHLPLRDGAVDIFVTDLPFGHRVGSRTDNRKLYPQVLEEMARVGRYGARACLLTGDKNNFIKAIQQTSRYWQRRRILSVNIGGIAAGVFLLLRTTTPFTRCHKSPLKHHDLTQSHHADDTFPHASDLEREKLGEGSAVEAGKAQEEVIAQLESAAPQTVTGDVPLGDASTSTAAEVAAKSVEDNGLAFLDKDSGGVGGGNGGERAQDI